MKFNLLFLLPLCVFFYGCSASQLSTLDSDAVVGLSLIQSATAAASSSGVLTGSTASIVSDVGITANALGTLLTGQPITTAQATSVAASYKSNATTTAYVAAGVPVINALVSLVNAKIASGASTATVVAAGTQLLANAPSAAQAGLVPMPPAGIPSTSAALPFTSVLTTL